MRSPADTHCPQTRIDRFGRTWHLPDRELCADCGQPDSLGECSHGRLDDAEVLELGGNLS